MVFLREGALKVLQHFDGRLDMLKGLEEMTPDAGQVDKQHGRCKDAAGGLGGWSIGAFGMKGGQVFDGSIALLQSELCRLTGCPNFERLVFGTQGDDQVSDWRVVDGRSHHLPSPKGRVEVPAQGFAGFRLEVEETPSFGGRGE
jgi:hypothetical protein